jgi:hypothetical protein
MLVSAVLVAFSVSLSLGITPDAFWPGSEHSTASNKAGGNRNPPHNHGGPSIGRNAISLNIVSLPGRPGAMGHSDIIISSGQEHPEGFCFLGYHMHVTLPLYVSKIFIVSNNVGWQPSL